MFADPMTAQLLDLVERRRCQLQEVKSIVRLDVTDSLSLVVEYDDGTTRLFDREKLAKLLVGVLA